MEGNEVLGQMHALGPQVCGAVSQQAAPAEAVRAGEHDGAVQQAQADGAAVLRLQLIRRRRRRPALAGGAPLPRRPHPRGRRRRLQALHAGTRPIMRCSK